MIAGRSLPRLRREAFGAARDHATQPPAISRYLADGGLLRLGSLLLVILVAVFLRVIDLDRVGFNSDEAVYSGQAGALAGEPAMSSFFSVFRAHPLLLQTLLGGWFELAGASELSARLFMALIFGVGSIILTFMLGSKLYGYRVGILAAALLAVLPYHVAVSRQILLDSPLAFLTLLTLWFAAHAEEDQQGRWVVFAGLAAGLAAASKEVGVLLLPMLAGMLLVSGRWRQIPVRRLILGALLFALLTLPYPLSRLLFAPENGSAYLFWQISREPNHDAMYLLEVLGSFSGIVFVLLAFSGLALMISGERGQRRSLILLWIAVYFSFFQIWPTKLFSYLMPVIPALAICAAYSLDTAANWLASRAGHARQPSALLARAFVPIAVLLLALHLGDASLSIASRGTDTVGAPLSLDVEVQDFAGGRELGEWAAVNTPADSKFLTIGPSVGNLMRYYGNRDSVALSVSPDPRYRNPAYIPVENPDLWFRQLGIHYIVWDAYSADRSAFYSGRLNYYARKFGGTVLFAVYQRADGSLILGEEEGASPRIIVYDAMGGNPLVDVPPRTPVDPTNGAEVN